MLALTRPHDLDRAHLRHSRARPFFFFLDVRNDEKQAFLDLVKKEPGVTTVETAPMLRDGSPILKVSRSKR